MRSWGPSGHKGFTRGAVTPGGEIIGADSEASSDALARALQEHLTMHLVAAPSPCAAALERLGRYVAGALSRDQALGVEAHVAFCEACTARWQDLKELHGLWIVVDEPSPIGEAPPHGPVPDAAEESQAHSSLEDEEVAAATPIPPRHVEAEAATPAPPAVEESTAGGAPVRRALKEPKAADPPPERRPKRAVIRVIPMLAAFTAVMALVIVGMLAGDYRDHGPQGPTGDRTELGAGTAAPTLEGATDVEAPIDPEALGLVDEVARAAARRDYVALEPLLDVGDTRGQMAMLRTPGVIEQLLAVLATRPAPVDGYRDGYHYPGFAFRSFDRLNPVHLADMAFLRVPADGSASGSCNGYAGVTTSFEKRTARGAVRYAWVGVRRC